MTPEECANKIAKVIAEAAKLPLMDAAFLLWRQQIWLDTLEGRPTAEEIAINRALTPEQWMTKYRYQRAHAYEGPMLGHLTRAHPHADEKDIRHAIIAAVAFDDDCFKYFDQNGDFWGRCVRAVALAAKNHPGYLDTTYRDACNHVAYHMK
jgi:hypothetical protein